MATKLEKTLKREIEIDGKAYMVAISPRVLLYSEFSQGSALTWRSIISGGPNGPAQMISWGDSEEKASGFACWSNSSVARIARGHPRCS